MSAGKIAAQVAQATVGAWELSMRREQGPPNEIAEMWWSGDGHHHTTYVMQAENSEHLYSIERYLNARGFLTYLMIDEGMTEIRSITPTVLAVEIVDKDDPHTEASFMAFKLYRDKKPENPGNSRKKRKLPWFV